MNIVKEFTYDDLYNNVNGEFFDEKNRLKFHVFPGGSLVITDLTNAMKPGKTCRKWILQHRDWPQPESGAAILNVVNKVAEKEAKNTTRWKANKMKWFMRNLRGLPGPTPWDDPFVLPFAVKLEIRDEESKRTYSPFTKINPLKSYPTKWTMAHVKRALATGQYENAKCRGIYTDDYAFDNAYDFQKGSISGAALLKTIVESPSGWWTSIENTRVSVCCHHFDSNEFTLKLGA